MSFPLPLGAVPRDPRTDAELWRDARELALELKRGGLSRETALRTVAIELGEALLSTTVDRDDAIRTAQFLTQSIYAVYAATDPTTLH